MTEKKETLDEGDFSPEGKKRVGEILKMNFQVTLHSKLTLRDPIRWEVHGDVFSDPYRWESLTIYGEGGQKLFHVYRDLN